MKKGRPSKKTPEIIERILDELGKGLSLVKICADPGMPETRTVLRWLDANEDFVAKYIRAKEAGADAMAEQTILIADGANDRTAVEKAKVQNQARQWYASKLYPKKYGDRINLDHSGSLKIDKVIIEHVNAAPPTDG